jgi:ADP-heptose:LPS heptosyltransferase
VKSFQIPRLCIRLSSLGDIVLSSTVLEVETLSFSRDSQVDWLTSPEYASLLESHSRIRDLLIFDRKNIFVDWLRFCRMLWDRNYEEVYDLHRSLRTLVLRVLFFGWGVFYRKKSPVWKSLGKQRARFLFYILFKRFWPSSLRPFPLVRRYALLLGGTGKERPSLKHLLIESNEDSSLKVRRPFFCVMPGSHWQGKIWPVSSYLKLLKQSPMPVVVLGRSSDWASVQLVKGLQELGMEYVSGIGRWSLPQVAWVLKEASFYLGSDTGMAHMAEAVGTPTIVLLGPSREDMGFGPWQSRSQVVGQSLWCRPCGKDGRYCWRPFRKQACLKTLDVELVRAAMVKNRDEYR